MGNEVTIVKIINIEESYSPLPEMSDFQKRAEGIIDTDPEEVQRYSVVVNLISGETCSGMYFDTKNGERYRQVNSVNFSSQRRC